MIVFLVYIVGILFVLTLCAAIAEFIGWMFPDWLDSWQAEADESFEDSTTTEGTVSSALQQPYSSSQQQEQS